MTDKDFERPDDGDEVLGEEGSEVTADEAAAPGPDPQEDGDALTVEDILGAEQTDEAAVAESDQPDLLLDLKRLQAEYANYRRRTEEQRQVEIERAKGSVAKGLLPVLDDLDRAEKHGDLGEGSALLAMCRSLHVMAGGPRSVALVVNVEQIQAPVALAQPLLLAVNELVVNALRHAFPDSRPGAIEVKANIIDDKLVVIVADNGVGMPISQSEPSGFGSKLINMMTAKIDATLAMDTVHGVRFTITAPAPKILADIDQEADAI